MSHTSSYDPLSSNRYHDLCLQSLIPMLDQAVTVSDESLFAATIILRVLEEMEGRLPYIDRGDVESLLRGC